MTVHQYATRFAELSHFAAYLIPDEENKAKKFEDSLNYKIYELVMVLQIQNFSKLVHKEILVEQNLKRATPQGFSSMDQGPWNKRNEGSSLSQRQIQGNHTTNPCKFCNCIHVGERRKEVGSCFKCGKDWHFIREFPLLEENNRRPYPPQRFRPNNQGNNQRRLVPARVFALTPREAEDKNDVITDYNLRVSTLVGDIVTYKKILLKCPITISGREMPTNLIAFPMIGFDVILGMDWLASSYASIDCFKKEVVFKFSEGEELQFLGSRVHTLPSVISAFQVGKLIRDECQGYLAFVVDEPKQELELEKIPTVREYPEVFPEDLSGLPPEREVEFAIELAPATAPLSKAPY
ncbi:hypothetical protein F2P56_008811 [Juglans regia]|uniref:Uncharacterized protein LOC108992526 n=2 Tax=Juglans regia TaxID=51240 RepID=A0A2I4ETF8_JUGRE|nr:uncharacterized protein LOC108992526 [Juglans regia]KAF5472064.1 hypothetical protein F2P56_008811 [Juglans regia]